MLEIRDGVTLPESDLSYETSRSSGPGGQNVNKVETRVAVLFDLEGTTALDGDQKAAVRERLGSRLSKAGVLRVASQKHRSQAANRQAARERLALLLRSALEPEKARRPTRVSPAVKRRRLEGKRRRASVKSLRRPPARDGEG